MDTIRFILIFSLCLVTMLLWDAWQRDYGKQAPTSVVETDTKEILDAPPAELTVTNTERPDITSIKDAGKIKEKIITITTDVLRLDINTHGGGIEKAALLKFPITTEENAEPIQLLKNNPETIYIIQGGLISELAAPAHDAIYTTTSQNFYMGEQDTLNATLLWEGGGGLQVKKIYEFKKGKYLIDVKYEVTNSGSNPWTGRAYAQLQQAGKDEKFNGAVYTYTGAVISSPEKRYEKISFEDIEEQNLKRGITNGWIAMIQHYFLSAVIPGSPEEEYRYYTIYLDKKDTGLIANRHVIGATTQAKQISAGQTDVFSHKLYIGPKLQDNLEKIAPGLELTVDYGVLWFIAKPLFWCLKKFHTLSGNWGWSIVLVTLMLKILFYQLSAAGYRSMANMRRVQPRLLAIRERYKNDRARLNQAMMEIYKEEKINPLGGCFPILVQIPVFIALYWVLLESVELRQADFVLWINDLSTPDPYFVLPLVMGATMLIQQKLNPAPMDPVQEKVLMVLPIVFTVFFAFFPSGLVLYWVANNILSIAQQWLITSNLERAGIKS